MITEEKPTLVEVIVVLVLAAAATGLACKLVDKIHCA